MSLKEIIIKIAIAVIAIAYIILPDPLPIVVDDIAVGIVAAIFEKRLFSRK